jgi:hypothetical protein
VEVWSFIFLKNLLTPSSGSKGKLSVAKWYEYMALDRPCGGRGKKKGNTAKNSSPSPSHMA